MIDEILPVDSGVVIVAVEGNLMPAGNFGTKQNNHQLIMPPSFVVSVRRVN